MKGDLIIIGGAEDKSKQSDILSYIADSANKKKGIVSVITTATEDPEKAWETYNKAFRELKVSNITMVDIKTREDAENQSFIETLKNSAVIFFTGGDQLRLTGILGGTGAHTAIKEANENGAVISGTSAGASVMSNTMIVEGNSDDTARKSTINMSPGLGLVEGVIVDQHFAQRGRVGRLLSGVAQNPGVLGIGIDENTAIIVGYDRIFKVIGTNSVTVIDGKSIQSTNISELQQNEVLSITNATIHVLTKGYGFDMNTRKVQRM